MRNVLLAILGIIDLLANIPYIIDTYRGKTKPNVAAWSTLTLINGITAVAGLAAHNALNTAVLGFSYLAGSVIILGLALWKGTRKYTKFDLFFQVLALLGLVLWFSMHSPAVALATTIVVGELAAVPMYRHAYLFPGEETWSTFLVASLVALGTLCLATSVSFASIAVPVDMVIGNGMIAAVILIRRRGLRPDQIHQHAEPIA